MSSLLAALRSSIGKKFVMGITGLFLCVFLLIHLAGNFLLFIGADAYNAYAHKLHATPAFLYTAEFFLYVAFFAHIYLAFHTSGINWTARGDVNYTVKRTKIYNRSLAVQAESIMFFTGAMILGFTIIHLLDFKWHVGWGEIDHAEPFVIAQTILSSTTRKFVYAIGSLFVGLHVVHGFRSAFQSLGVNHPKYNTLLQKSSIAFAIIVAIGFASFPLLISKGSTPVMQPAPAAQTPQ